MKRLILLSLVGLLGQAVAKQPPFTFLTAEELTTVAGSESGASGILSEALTTPLAAAETWSWFRTVSTGTAWWITQGRGDVNFSGSSFKATLLDGEDPLFIRLSLQGSVSGGFVKARITVHESDVPVVEVSGRLKRLCWAKGGGREILVLTNGEQVLGLFRELDSSMPCKATR